MRLPLRSLTVFMVSVTCSCPALSNDIFENKDKKVVSYFVEGRKGVEWRLFVPEAKKDTVIAVHGAMPKRLFWSTAQRAAYYTSGDRFYRLDWRYGARPEALFDLPKLVDHSQIHDIWFDLRSRRWRASAVEWVQDPEVVREELNGTERSFIVYKGTRVPATKDQLVIPHVASVLEYDQAGWRFITHRMTYCGDFHAPCLSVLKDEMHQGPALSEVDLHESMSIEYRLTNEDKWLDESYPRGVVLMRSKHTPNRKLRVAVHEDHTPHAITPLYYLNEDSATEKVIYSAPTACGSFEQLAFEEHGRFLLVGTEYRLECSRLVDMQTGDTVHVFPPKARPLWITAPEAS